MTEARILREDGVHVIYCVDKGWDVNLVKIQPKHVMKASFDAGDSVDTESGRSLDVFPGDHSNVLGEGPEI